MSLLERTRRKNFITKYGKILPSNFCPELKNKPADVKVINADSDANLPNIDEHLLPEEAYNNN